MPGSLAASYPSRSKSGFIGGIVAGLLAGYLTYYLNKGIKLPPAFNGLKPILILPLLSTAIVGLVMYYIVGTPVAMLTAAITDFLSGLSGAGNIALGIVCGLLYFDMGGAVSKVLYAFAIGMLDAGVYGPMATVMLCGMVPPLASPLRPLPRRACGARRSATQARRGAAGLLLHHRGAIRLPPATRCRLFRPV